MLSLHAWTRGERMILLAGAPLAVVLWALPWHRYGLTVADDFRRLGLGEIPLLRPIEVTALENPNAFLGWGALILAVAMVVAVVAGRLLATRRPLSPAWQQAHLLAGAAALGLLVAKVATRGEYLTIGAWAGTGLAALLAYAGYVRSQEEATGMVAGPGSGAAPAPPPATDGD